MYLERLSVVYKLSIINIHSPDYIFTVLVSIFISKTHNHLSTINVFLLVYVGRVMEFSASITPACTLLLIEKWRLRLERLNCSCSDGSVLVVNHPKHYGCTGKGGNECWYPFWQSGWDWPEPGDANSLIGSLICKHLSAAALPVIVHMHVNIILASAGYAAALAPLTICSLILSVFLILKHQKHKLCCHCWEQIQELPVLAWLIASFLTFTIP